MDITVRHDFLGLFDPNLHIDMFMILNNYKVRTSSNLEYKLRIIARILKKQ